MSKLPFDVYVQVVLSSSKYSFEPLVKKKIHGIRFMRISHDADLDKTMRLYGKKNTIFYQELTEDSKEYFLKENYKKYINDPRSGKVVTFNDVLLMKYKGGQEIKLMYMSKHHMDTRKKMRKILYRAIGVPSECCVCSVHTEDMVSCGKCFHSLCMDCSTKWEQQKGNKYTCPMCRQKGNGIRVHLM